MEQYGYEDINWDTLRLALRCFNQADHTRLHKFLHDWLPLRGANHATTATTNPTCPHCQREAETLWHFLECQHRERNK